MGKVGGLAERLSFARGDQTVWSRAYGEVGDNCRPTFLWFTVSFITAYVDGEIDTGPVRTKDEIRDYLDAKNYGHRYEQARTREEKKKFQREA